MSIKRNKIFVIFLLIFSPIIKGQINKGNFLFSLNGNYIKASKEDGTSMNYISSNFKDLYIGSKISYVINNKFFIGVGLDYYWNKKHKQSFYKLLINYYNWN